MILVRKRRKNRSDLFALRGLSRSRGFSRALHRNVITHQPRLGHVERQPKDCKFVLPRAHLSGDVLAQSVPGNIDAKALAIRPDHFKDIRLAKIAGFHEKF